MNYYYWLIRTKISSKHIILLEAYNLYKNFGHYLHNNLSISFKIEIKFIFLLICIYMCLIQKNDHYKKNGKTAMIQLQWYYCQDITAMILLRWYYFDDKIVMIKLRWYYCDDKIAMVPLRWSYLSPINLLIGREKWPRRAGFDPRAVLFPPLV